VLYGDFMAIYPNSSAKALIKFWVVVQDLDNSGSPFKLILSDLELQYLSSAVSRNPWRMFALYGGSLENGPLIESCDICTPKACFTHTFNAMLCPHLPAEYEMSDSNSSNDLFSVEGYMKHANLDSGSLRSTLSIDV
jgi:hypothetical protein